MKGKSNAYPKFLSGVLLSRCKCDFLRQSTVLYLLHQREWPLIYFCLPCSPHFSLCAFRRLLLAYTSGRILRSVLVCMLSVVLGSRCNYLGPFCICGNKCMDNGAHQSEGANPGFDPRTCVWPLPVLLPRATSLTENSYYYKIDRYNRIYKEYVVLSPGITNWNPWAHKCSLKPDSI